MVNENQQEQLPACLSHNCWNVDLSYSRKLSDIDSMYPSLNPRYHSLTPWDLSQSPWSANNSFPDERLSLIKVHAVKSMNALPILYPMETAASFPESRSSN